MNKKTIGYIELFLAGISWGLIGLFTKGLSNCGLNSLEISFLRQFFAFVFVGMIVILKYGIKSLKVDKKSFFLLVIHGGIVSVCFCVFYALTIRILGVSAAVIMMYLAPVFVCIISFFLFKEKISAIMVLAIVLNLAGCIVSATGGDLKAVSFEKTGLIFGVLTGLCYAFVSVFGKVFANRGIGTFTSVFYMTLISSLVLFVLAMINPSGASLFRQKVLLNGFGCGLFGTALAYLFYYSGLNKPINVSCAPIISSIEIVVGALIGVFVFNEPFNFYMFAGILLVLLSIVVTNIFDNHRG